MHDSPVSASDPSPTRVRWWILAALCLAATTAYVQRQCLGTVEKQVREQLGLSLETMASVLSSFFITYALLQIPASWLAERLGTRRALTGMALAWSGACGCIALVDGVNGLLACRLAMGAAQAGIFTCTTLSIRRWLPIHRRGLANGVLAGFMQVGGFCGAVFAGWLTETFGWRLMFLIFAIPGLAWALWFWRFFRDEPADHPAINAGELQLLPPAQPAHSAGHTTPVPWLGLLVAWPLWCLAGQQFFRAGAQMFYGSWFSTYLQESRGVGLTEAGVLNGLPIAAAVVGPIAGGWLSDVLEARIGDRRISRQGLAVVCLLICAGLMWVGYQVDNVRLSVTVIGLGAFFAAAAGPAAYTVTIDMGGKSLAPVFAIMNMWGNIGAAAFPFLIPLVLGTASRRPGDPPPNWDGVFQVFTLLYVLAAVCWIPFNSTRTLFPADETSR